jgi:hypothetical protein
MGSRPIGKGRSPRPFFEGALRQHLPTALKTKACAGHPGNETRVQRLASICRSRGEVRDVHVVDHWDFDLTTDSGKALEPGMSCVRRILDAIPPAGDGHDSWRDDVLLVACELLSNAHLHTPGATRLDIDIDGDQLIVAVTDQATTRPAPQPWRLDTLHGRGLHIIDCLATDWGVTPIPGGKTVWAALPLDTTPQLPDRATR